jgi:hypothetical protein
MNQRCANFALTLVCGPVGGGVLGRLASLPAPWALVAADRGVLQFAQQLVPVPPAI